MNQPRVVNLWGAALLKRYRKSRFSYSRCLPVLRGMILVVVLIASDRHGVLAQQIENGPIASPYISLFMTHSEPTGGSYRYLEDRIPSLTVGSGNGGGVKLGAYLRPLNYGVGIELESFVHSGSLTAPVTVNGGATRFADQDFTKVHVMVNFLLRYRSDFIQPYLGAGPGFSAVFTKGLAQSAGGLQSGSHGMTGFAAQGIAGARMMITRHFFLFSEYKFLVSYTNADHCGGQDQNQSNPCKVLNQLSFLSHYATAGFGFSF